MKKLQSQPEYVRKIILWLIVLGVGAGLFFFWIKSVQKKFQVFSGENLKERFQPPSALEEQFKNLPKLEMPTTSEQSLKELEELLKTATETAATTE